MLSSARQTEFHSDIEKVRWHLSQRCYPFLGYRKSKRCCHHSSKNNKKLFHPSKTPNDHEAGKSPNHTSPESSKMSHQSIDKISRFIFPLCFFLFCISYFIYFCR
ncbi:UNVERIFIED_CONTAM: hypothetical protein NCL1_46167 [Trichonephila clavipes]